jgi:hypothetical protein
MKELFLSECRRFRNLALASAAIHLAVQVMLSRLMEPLQRHWTEQGVVQLLAGLAGLGFAALQFSTHRQPSRWVWLLHRPLSRIRIFGALALAALAVLAFAIGLPLLLAVLGTDRLTGRTVDARHYVIPVYLTLVSLVAWLGAAYLMLCGRRWAFVVLLVPSLFIGHIASGAALVPAALACVAMMAALVYTAVKPDRIAPPSSPAGLLAAGLPLVLGFYVLMGWGGALAFQSGQMLFGVHPLNTAVPPAGGYTELTRATGRANLERALAASDDPRAAHWRRQVALLDVGKVRPEGHEHVVPGQIANIDTLQFHQPDKGIVWTFSHDRMMYQGRDAGTGAPRGWFGRNGTNDPRPFDHVPVLPGKFILTRHELLLPDFDSGRTRPMLTVRAPETLTGGLQEVGMQAYLLTNQRLIAYRKPAVPDAPLQELYSVPLPGPFGDLARVDVARMLDGTLLSFNFGRRMAQGEAGSRQHLLFVDTAGRAQTLHSRPLEHDFPALFEHRTWWLSPVLHTLAGLPERLMDKGIIADLPAQPPQSRPAIVAAAALCASLLSAALAAWRLARAQGTSRRRRLAWCVAALVLGPPCVAVLWVLGPRPAPATRAAAPAPALVPAPA